MILRSFPLLGWLDEELSLLSFLTKESKSSLVRKMLVLGLQAAWRELLANNEPVAGQKVLSNANLEQNGLSEDAKRVLARHNDEIAAAQG